MKSFKEYLIEKLLLEWDKQKTLLNNADKLSAAIKKDKTAKDFTPESLIDKFAELDPTNNKVYVGWLIKQFVDGIKYEDIGQSIPWLEKFHSIKNSTNYTDAKDIGGISFKQLSDIYLKYKDVQSKRQSEIQVKKGAKLVFENSLASVIVPETKEASCLYGAGTTWCTAYTNSKNKFDEYNDQGPLFIITPKKPSYEKEKYQFHFASNEYNDDSNTALVYPREILDKFKLYDFFQKEYPHIKKSIPFQTKEGLLNKIKYVKEEIKNYLNSYQENLLDEKDFLEYLEGAIELDPDEISELSYNELVKYYNDFYDDGFINFAREVTFLLNNIDPTDLYQLAQKESIVEISYFPELISTYIYNELKSGNYESKLVYDLQDFLKNLKMVDK